MKNKKILVIIVFLLIIGLSGLYLGLEMKNKKPTTLTTEKTPAETPEPEVTLAQDSDFNYSFLKLESANKNLIYSPLSIKYALKMADEGATGETKTEIDNLLKDPTINKYNNIEGRLSLANALFIRDNFKDSVKEDFIKTNTDKYNAEVIYDSFATPTVVNNWVDQKTMGLIKEIVTPEVLTPDTELVLVNALAIDMEWQEPFDASDTIASTFYPKNGSTKNVAMMSRDFNSDNVSYYQDDTTTAIKMPLKKYDNTNFEFLAIMPDDLDSYIKTIDSSTITNLESQLTKTSTQEKGVNISIPKFKFDYELSLKDDLISLGIKQAFDSDNASFTNISDTHLYIANALHKATINFYEEGVKAGAATALTFDKNSMMEQKFSITINKPFLFIIKDQTTNDIWFVGTCYEPTAWSSGTEA